MVTQMGFGSIVGWTLGAAVLTPLAPLGIVYYFVHEVHQSGNGADAWGTFGMLACGVVGTIALATLVGAFLLNPIVGGVLYGAWCLTAGVAIGSRG